jgi:hypothetical protein
MWMGYLPPTDHNRFLDAQIGIFAEADACMPEQIAKRTAEIAG